MRRWLVLLIALAVLAIAPSVYAGPTLVAKPLGGPAPLALTAEGSGFIGRFTVENKSAEPVKISGIKPRPGLGAVPRLPPGLTVSFEDGRPEGTLGPGELRRAVVRWVPRREQGPDEVHGHVMVEADDADPAVLGIVAVRGKQSFFAAHALSLLLALPLLGIVLLLGLHFARYRKLRQLRGVATAVALAQLAVCAVVYGQFDPSVARYAGGDGFQLVEATPLLPALGIQYLAGIDGISVLFVLLVPLVLLIASLIGDSVDRRVVGFWCWLLVLEAGLLGAFVLLDLALWLVAWLLAAIAVVSLVGGWSAGRRTSLRPAAYFALATVLIALAFIELSAHAGPSYLLDGSRASRAWAYTELIHAGFLAQGGIGATGIKLAFSALFIGFALLMAAPPLHGWLLSAVGTSPAAVGVLLLGGVVPLGAYGLVRFGFGLLPEGVAWATTTIAVLGVLGALWAALGAIAERELSRFSAYAVAAQSGFVLIALSGLTGMAVQGALALVLSLALSGAGLLAVAAALRDRVRISDSSRFGGLAAELPVFGVLAGAIFFGSMAMPGTIAFIGQAAGLAGAFPTHPALVLAAIAVLIAIGAAHLSTYSRAFLGKLPESWRRSRFLEPHGGRFPALESRELVALGLLAALVVLLGIYPKPLTRLTDSSALDYAERVRPPGPTQVVYAPEAKPGSSLRLALK